MPEGATPDFSAKTVGGDSLSCSEATGDYTLDAISRSTEILFNSWHIRAADSSLSNGGCASSKLLALIGVMPPVGGDALADTEALYDESKFKKAQVVARPAAR